MAKKRKIKYGKGVLVLFITALVWVWADRAQDETYSVPNPVIAVPKYTNPDIWVSFDEKSTVTLDKLDLKGPAGRIDALEKEINERLFVPEFFLEPAQEEAMTPGEHPLNVLSFLRKNDKLSRVGLTVDACKPETLVVSVEKLVQKKLTVRCLDENGDRLEQVSIEPAQIDMAVPGSWEGGRLVADVKLAARERDLARKSPIEKTPRIELVPGWTWDAPIPVMVTMSQDEVPLSPYRITTPTLGIVFSQTLQGRYRVEITNEEDVKGAISIRATMAAKLAYESPSTTRFQVILEIDDEDEERKGAELKRPLIYNFPADLVRKGEIELKDTPVVAQFKLVPLAAPE